MVKWRIDLVNQYSRIGSPLTGVIPAITRMIENTSVVDSSKFYHLIREPSVKFAC